MNPSNLRYTKYAAALLAALTLPIAAGLANAQSNDDRSLRNGAVEDVTPQQKYQSAIREAGGAYKESQRDCALLAGAMRTTCLREAKATYDQDMADAKRLLTTPRGM